MFVKLQAELREDLTKGGRTSLRKNGRIPAVVYGKKVSDVPISVDEKEVMNVFRKQSSSLVELEIPGKLKETAIIQEIQRDVFSNRLISLGFHQIDVNEEVRVKVALELKLEPQDKDLDVQFLHYELEVQCLPDKIPNTIEIDPEPLRSGNSVLLSDISLPEGVSCSLSPEEVLITTLNVAVEKADAEDESESTEPQEPALVGEESEES